MLLDAAGQRSIEIKWNDDRGFRFIALPRARCYTSSHPNITAIRSMRRVDAARQFYRDTLQLGDPIYDLPEVGWIEFRSGSSPGNVAVTAAEAGWVPTRSTTIVFNVADCNVACAELRQRGVRCEEPVVFPGYVTFCSFYDPFGNRLQMCSPAPEQRSPR